MVLTLNTHIIFVVAKSFGFGVECAWSVPYRVTWICCYGSTRICFSHLHSSKNALEQIK